MRKKKILAVALACAMVAQSSVGVLADTTKSEVEASSTEVITETGEEGAEEYPEPIITRSEEKVSEDGYRYVITTYEYSTEEYEDVYITGYEGNEKDLFIPRTIDGYYLDGIEDYAMANNSSITSVTMEGGYGYIGAAAFYNCSSLEYVNINKVYELGTDTDTLGVFGNCENLKVV